MQTGKETNGLLVRLNLSRTKFERCGTGEGWSNNLRGPVSLREQDGVKLCGQGGTCYSALGGDTGKVRWRYHAVSASTSHLSASTASTISTMSLTVVRSSTPLRYRKRSTKMVAVRLLPPRHGWFLIKPKHRVAAWRMRSAPSKAAAWRGRAKADSTKERSKTPKCPSARRRISMICSVTTSA